MLKDFLKLICCFNSSYINKSNTERRGIKKQLQGEVGLFTENFQPVFCNQKCKSLAPGKPAVGLLAHKQEVQPINARTRGSRQAGRHAGAVHRSSLLAAWFIVRLICNFLVPAGLLGEQLLLLTLTLCINSHK